MMASQRQADERGGEALVPRLHVIAGPMGAGKSAYLRDLAELYADSDSVAAIGDSPVAARLPNAIDIAAIGTLEGSGVAGTRARAASLANGESFGLETRLASDELGELLPAASRVGYQLSMTYVSTESPDETLERLFLRAKKRLAPETVDEVRSSYAQSIAAFKSLSDVFDRVDVFDNSSDRLSYVLTLERGRVVEFGSDPAPEWVKKSLGPQIAIAEAEAERDRQRRPTDRETAAAYAQRMVIAGVAPEDRLSVTVVGRDGVEHVVQQAAPLEDRDRLRAAADALERIPQPILEALAQFDLKISILETDEIESASEPRAGFYNRENRTVVVSSHALTDREPALLLFEIGRAVDHLLAGGAERNNSDSDAILRGAYLNGEVMSDYSREGIAEGFADCFVAWTNTEDWLAPTVGEKIQASLMGSPIETFHGRDDGEAKAPTVMDYLDGLERSVAMALERDPKAFTRESRLDVGVDVVARSQIALTLGVVPDRISVEDLVRLRVRVDFGELDRLEMSAELAQRQIYSLPVYEPPAGAAVIWPEDRLAAVADFAESMTVLGRNAAGDRVYGRSGGAVLSVSSDAFTRTPEAGKSVVLRSDGLAHDQDAGLSRESAAFER